MSIEKTGRISPWLVFTWVFVAAMFTCAIIAAFQHDWQSVAILLAGGSTAAATWPSLGRGRRVSRFRKVRC